MSRTAFVAATLALSLALGGCSSFLSATRDKPIDDDRGTRTIGSKIDDSLIETKAAVNIAKGRSGPGQGLSHRRGQLQRHRADRRPDPAR